MYRWMLGSCRLMQVGLLPREEAEVEAAKLKNARYACNTAALTVPIPACDAAVAPAAVS